MIVFNIYSLMNKHIPPFSRDLHWWGVYSKEGFDKRKLWLFMRIGCQELGRACRWCEEHDVDKACQLCREGGLEKTSLAELGKFA